MVKTRDREHRTRRQDRKGRRGATKGKREATMAGNLGGNKAESSIVRGHKRRTIGKREHRACAQANALSGNETSLMLRSLGTWRQGVQCVRVGILTDGMLTRAEEKRTMGIDTWQRRWRGTSLKDLDRARERGHEDNRSGQGHEARYRTCGDRLGVTDTPVCERFHGQRLWPPYIGVISHSRQARNPCRQHQIQPPVPLTSQLSSMSLSPSTSNLLGEIFVITHLPI